MVHGTWYMVCNGAMFHGSDRLSPEALLLTSTLDVDVDYQGGVPHSDPVGPGQERAARATFARWTLARGLLLLLLSST